MNSTIYKASVIILLVIILGLQAKIFMAFENSLNPKTTDNGQRSYFAIDETGRIIPIHPLDQKNLSDKKLRSWIASAISQSLTLNNKNYREQLEYSGQYYNRRGWESFTKWLQNPNLSSFEGSITNILDKDVDLVFLKSLDNIQIISEEVQNSQYQWNIKIGLTLGFLSNKNIISAEKKSFDLIIIRSNKLDSFGGISISLWQESII
jgi:hypothetical protein